MNNKCKIRSIGEILGIDSQIEIDEKEILHQNSICAKVHVTSLDTPRRNSI